MTQETYEDGDTVTYKYDNDGALATVTDSATGITTTYYYDFTDRRMKYVESGSDFSHSVGYEYDTVNNLSKLVETINGDARTISYSYDDDNRVIMTTNSGSDPVSTADDIVEHYAYDSYGRVHTKTTTYGGTEVLTESYAYVGDDEEDNVPPSTQVKKVTTEFGDITVIYEYAYDSNGNITSVKEITGGTTKTTTYVYDSANQLIRENDGTIGLTWMYDYDDAGNMTRSRMCFYSTTDSITELEEENYTYGDSSWGDLLTGWNGKSFSYDTIGNLTSDGTWSYTWEHGRELASMTDGSTTWSFSYDANGMRTARSNGSRIYSYVYNGSSLSQLVVDGHALRFTYDASGRPLSVTYDGTEYYYVLNLQGDVRAIVDGSGNEVVTYNYDAWGNIRWQVTGSMKDTLGFYNPLRYRGYVYDSETGLYYVSSRYYDSEIGRWINADDTVYLGADGTLLSYNLFAYCKNNPVMGYDPTGHFSWNDLFNTAAVVTVAAIAVIAIIGSGGTAAPPLLALASTIAGTTVTASAATAAATSIAITGIAVMGTAATAGVMEASRKNNSGNSSQNNEFKGGFTYNKSGERIDYEYNGNGSGNVHYQGSKGKQMIWTLKDGIETTHTVTKAVVALISTPEVQRAISKAITFVRSLAGL